VARSMAAQIEGLRRMTVPQLRKKWVEIFGKAPHCDNRAYLWRRLAWQVQADAEGGLSERAKGRIDELNRNLDVDDLFPRKASKRAAGRAKAAPRRDPRLPSPGTVIRRSYRGQDISVKVLDDGFEYDGRPYRSLSAVAEAVTGSHWNGFLFFGIEKGKAG